MRNFIKLTGHFGSKRNVYIDADSIIGISEITIEESSYTEVCFGSHRTTVEEKPAQILELLEEPK